MDAKTVGEALVTMASQGRAQEQAFVDQYYAAEIISIEGQGTEEMPGRIQGIDAVRAKHNWWYDNNTVHGVTLEGPYIGHREDQFVVKFTLDTTPTGGERSQMQEVGLFTVAEGKIIHEEFLYLMA